jgi:hypothetical protein
MLLHSQLPVLALQQASSLLKSQQGQQKHHLLVLL